MAMIPAGLKKAEAVTDDGRNFQALVCEQCEGDIFHIGMFAGAPFIQCATCFPKLSHED